MADDAKKMPGGTPMEGVRSVGPRRFLEQWGPQSMIRRGLGLPTAGQEMYGEFLNPTREPGVALHAKGGAVKRGSSTVPAMCDGGKVVRSWSK